MPMCGSNSGSFDIWAVHPPSAYSRRRNNSAGLAWLLMSYFPKFQDFLLCCVGAGGSLVSEVGINYLVAVGKPVEKEREMVSWVRLGLFLFCIHREEAAVGVLVNQYIDGNVIRLDEGTGIT